MLRYVIRRILYAVPILLGVALFTFLLFYVFVSPEQMARRNLTAKDPTPAQIQGWLKQKGYDKPLPRQFQKHITELFLLRFGKSDTTGENIWTRIKAGAGPSALIGGLMLVFGLLTSISFALAVAYYRGTYVDYWGTFLCVLLMSVVYVVWIIGGQYLFGRILKYFPLAGYRGGLNALQFVLLPMVIGVISGLGASVRFYRTVLLDEMNQDYVRTARAKGVGERAILFRHVLKNSLVPILTSTIASLPLLILGSLLLESFFGIPGLGSVVVDAINSQDFATVRAMTFLGALLYIVGLILTDISYAAVDPRVRLE